MGRNENGKVTFSMPETASIAAVVGILAGVLPSVGNYYLYGYRVERLEVVTFATQTEVADHSKKIAVIEALQKSR